jgi:hypothetical protein
LVTGRDITKGTEDTKVAEVGRPGERMEGRLLRGVAIGEGAADDDDVGERGRRGGNAGCFAMI